MHNAIIRTLAGENFRMSSIDRLSNVYHLLSQVLVFGVPGDVVELGCHSGRTSVLLRMVMDHYAPDRGLYVYDSFAGLPAPGPHDAGYLQQGDIAASRATLEKVFRRWQVALPHIVEGWFADTLRDQLPKRIAFAYLDADFYESTKIALEAVYPRLSPNAIVCLDDYCDLEVNPRAWAGLPGVKCACDDFLKDKPETVSVLAGRSALAMGYFRKIAAP